VVFGEVGLAGEIRPAPRGQERLREAAKLGFTHALIPKANAPKQEQAGAEPVAVLNHNRPAAYLLSPKVYEAMLERLSADLRQTIQEGIDSGPAIPADQVFAELNARYAEPRQVSKQKNKQADKRTA
jgi:PHD/YefM family antitoxin component YafN of YafNO toxin-antitoxin module